MNKRLFLFESSVIHKGTKTIFSQRYQRSKFESSVIHKGTKTKCAVYNGTLKFESSVIHKGTKTLKQLNSTNC